METPKFVLLLSCIVYHSSASEHSHTIPVENYETELQDLGEHVESHNPPAKVIKITKTIAVKIPVPYPVKVIEKVPYPVHISKPYPVPVPQIVHVPKHDSPPPNPHEEHEVLDAPHGYVHHSQQRQPNQEGPIAYDGGNSDYNQHFGSSDDEHLSEGPGPNYNIPNSYQGYSGDNGDSGSFESKNYGQATNQYSQQQHPGSRGNTFNVHYH